MDTSDLFKINRSSRRLKESFQKTFGKKLNLESFDLDKLHDARNKLRTQLSQVRSNSNFNEDLENDAYHQAQWMLDAINAEISEREEFIIDPQIEESNEVTMEKAPPGAKAERMVKHIKQGYAKDGELTDKERSIAYATAWKQHNKNESIEQGNDMTKLRESEINQASTIVTAKTMVDRVGRWIEELSGMENDTLLQLGDSIRDEIGQAEAKQFITSVAPAIQQALENLKTTRETLATAVHGLAGGETPDMLGTDDGSMDMEAPADPDSMNADPDSGLDDLTLDAPADDEFAAADAAAGGAEAAGREKRESIERQNSLLKVLAG
jgi:hypothetical protein